MARTTRKQVEGVFSILAKMMNKQVGFEPGNWWLDYAPEYGGYCVNENLPGGGITCPLGHQRRKAGEMWEAIHFALRLLEYRERA